MANAKFMHDLHVVVSNEWQVSFCLRLVLLRWGKGTLCTVLYILRKVFSSFDFDLLGDGRQGGEQKGRGGGAI